ncbi:MAG TPA: hypothetical protein DC061_09080, partial [Gemmobacter sp.]|nr:hypothetical protein [Gemmobacter sp.]
FLWNSDAEVGESDLIRDFKSGEDFLAFEVSRFGGMTKSLHLANDWALSSGEGTFIFDRSASTLYWDADGNGGGDPRIVAVLQGVTSLNAGDFQLL